MLCRHNFCSIATYIDSPIRWPKYDSRLLLWRLSSNAYRDPRWLYFLRWHSCMQHDILSLHLFLFFSKKKIITRAHYKNIWAQTQDRRSQTKSQQNQRQEKHAMKPHVQPSTILKIVEPNWTMGTWIQLYVRQIAPEMMTNNNKTFISRWTVVLAFSFQADPGVFIWKIVSPSSTFRKRQDRLLKNFVSPNTETRHSRRFSTNAARRERMCRIKQIRWCRRTARHRLHQIVYSHTANASPENIEAITTFPANSWTYSFYQKTAGSSPCCTRSVKTGRMLDSHLKKERVHRRNKKFSNTKVPRQL